MMRLQVKVFWAVLAVGWSQAMVWGVTINVPGDEGTIQAGIDAAVSGVDEVVVADGTYNEIIDFGGKAITVRSVNGAAVTTIDATGLPDPGDGLSVVRCISGEGASTVLDGFTIMGGTGDTAVLGIAVGGGMLNDGSNPTVTGCAFTGNAANFGGGMFGRNSSPTVTNCTFSGNTAVNGGGVANFNGGNPTLTNCSFSGNIASSVGGGLYNLSSSPTVMNCTFSGNASVFGGGGIFDDKSSPTVTTCTFSGNGGDQGGGIHNVLFSNPTVTNCTFSGNTANLEGGGMFIDGSSFATVINCAFSENTATNSGGGMFNDGGLTVTNCIFWENSDSGGMDESGQIHNGSGTPVVDFSDVQGGWTGGGGTGNINVDPQFVNAAGADLHLLAGSLCIDAGDDSVVTEGTDLDGNPRIANCTADMGAYETVAAGSVPADRDCDSDVDGVDFSVFASCFNKAGNPPRTVGCDPDDQAALDFDDDGDADGVDFSVFASCFNKAGNPPRTFGCPQN